MEQIELLDKINIHSSCRTCLGNTNEKHQNIFAIPELEKKFTVCTTLSLDPSDGFPTGLCESCHKKIDDIYDFQQMCILSHRRLQDYINSERKLCPSELVPADSINTSEVKKEDKNNSLSNEDVSELSDTEEPIIKSQDDSSSDDQEEPSDDDQPIAKYCKNKLKNDTKHDAKISLKCEICKKSFKKAETFEIHMRVHQGLKPFQCEQCDKSYARHGQLKVHIQVKHEKKPPEKFPCTEPDCGKTFCSKQVLRQHIGDSHCDNDNKTKQLYVCEECGKVLKSLSTLKNHIFLHSGEPRPHECPQCHKRYMTRCKLKNHLDRHAGIKNFVCPHCGARKSSRSELKNHVNYHTKEKTYPCQICNMVFNNIVNYSRHKRVVHEGIKKFSCSYCNKSFGKSETRKHHEMIHTGERPHECTICHKKFIQIVSLKKHQKVHLKAMGNG